MKQTILAVDAGKQSGAALFSGRMLEKIWTVKRSADRRAIIETAFLLEQRNGPGGLVVVAERWQGTWRANRRSTRTQTGIGAAWGRWAEALELLGHPKRRIVRVPPFEWHRVLPHGRDSAKARAVQLCRMKWPDMTFLTIDEAEAACIGLWAQDALAVRKLLPKRRG